MAEAVNGQSSPDTAPAPFVTLSEGVEMDIEPETVETPSQEAEAAEPAPKAEADAKADDKTPLDDIEYDENDPAQKAAYEALRKAMLPKWQKRVEALKAKPVETAPAAPEPKQETAPAEAGDWDPYTVDLEGFTYKGDPEPADSELAGFEEAIDRRVAAGVKQGIKHALDAMRVNDGKLREMQQVGVARDVISKFATAIQSHPDYPEKAAELAEFAQSTRELAIRNPEKWVRAAEALSGISRDWQGSDEPADETPAPRVQQPQRIVDKRKASVPLPTRARSTPTPPAGNMSVEEATNAAFRKHGLA